MKFRILLAAIAAIALQTPMCSCTELHVGNRAAESAEVGASSKVTSNLREAVFTAHGSVSALVHEHESLQTNSELSSLLDKTSVRSELLTGSSASDLQERHRAYVEAVEADVMSAGAIPAKCSNVAGTGVEAKCNNKRPGQLCSRNGVCVRSYSMLSWSDVTTCDCVDPTPGGSWDKVRSIADSLWAGDMCLNAWDTTGTLTDCREKQTLGELCGDAIDKAKGKRCVFVGGRRHIQIQPTAEEIEQAVRDRKQAFDAKMVITNDETEEKWSRKEPAVRQEVSTKQDRRGFNCECSAPA